MSLEKWFVGDDDKQAGSDSPSNAAAPGAWWNPPQAPPKAPRETVGAGMSATRIVGFIRLFSRCEFLNRCVRARIAHAMRNFVDKRMNAQMAKDSPSGQAHTQFADVPGRRLAYRTFGGGTPIVLCIRFRGTMDSWDPLFLDSLAARGFSVTIFDYSGLGSSTGEPTYQPASLARDAIDLMDALGLARAVVGGWSIGGIAAQLVMAQVPQRVSHLVLIATTPPGQLVKTGEALFYRLAGRENDFEDFLSVFFEPASPDGRIAAERSAQRLAERRDDASPEVPFEWARAQLGEGPRNPMFPVEAVLQALQATTIPILHIGGDHDIVFPVENWYALNGQLPTLQLLTLPSAGHGPQLQYPLASARHIAAFVEPAR
ncbi:alpha/beta fold hydrolase [Burkholderia gladioli]|uniref:alpha/beta fold hydrolase n=1 Tax=Burkholderia gladioli TaxID=28095 RepID=UPI0003A84D0D|nr:alpha/beta hydrolase [Burkholderia gladioli]